MDSDTSATFSAADINFIQGLLKTLRNDIANGRDYAGVLTAVCGHLERFQDGITTASPRKAFSPWAPFVCVTQHEHERAGGTIQITAPFLDHHLDAAVDSSQNETDTVRYLSAIQAACTKLEDIRKRSLAIIQKSEELEQEQKGLRQPADTTVDHHIRLLRQYNKTKDVGQQLIGMIAESRGVPLGDIYRHGDYGVSIDD